MPTIRTSLATLYRQQTGDTEANAHQIRSAWAQLPVSKQRMLTWRSMGRTLSEIAAAAGDIKRATVSSYLARALEQMRKTIHQEPRFNSQARSEWEKRRRSQARRKKKTPESTGRVATRKARHA